LTELIKSVKNAVRSGGELQVAIRFGSLVDP
jgi:hypothetical protein